MVDELDILKRDDKFKYQLLGRLQSDCEYYLGFGYRSDKRLWAGNVKDQIKTMKAIWKSFPKDKKPEWLKYKAILNYEKLMSSNI